MIVIMANNEELQNRQNNINYNVEPKISLNPTGLTEVGQTIVSDKFPITMDSFWFAINSNVVINPFDFVTAENFHDTRTIGIVKELRTVALDNYTLSLQNNLKEQELSSSTTTTTIANSTAEVAITPAVQPSQNLTIAFIDVGQGDSILVILPNTKTLLIDGGERESSGKVLATLREHGLSRIDVIVATHPHADHIGGLIDVIKNVDVGQVLDSGQVHTTQTFEEILDAIEMKQIPLKSVREGYSINLDPTVKIDVLNPPASLPDGADNEAEHNGNSVVLKLTYGEFSALLTGDMQEINEARLVFENAIALDAEVLKAGHHGSRTSSSSPFLNAVTPEVVIISVGAGNTYGHPHQEALDRISAAGTEHLFRTDVDGTITLTANGSSSEYSILTETSRKTIDVPKSEIVCWHLQ